MKQFAVLVLMLFGGTVGALVHPFFGIVPYYVLSIVRPQSLWDYALPEGVRWSLIAAGVATFGAVMHGPKLLVKLKWNPVAGLMAILAALILFSCLSAHDIQVANERGVEYFKIFFMALLTTAVVQRVAHLRWLTWVVFGCICYVAWEFNARYLFDNRVDILIHGHGGLDNNDTGVMLAMGLPLCYYWWRRRVNVWTGLSAGLSALVMVHALMLSYSRSGMVAGVAGLLWLALHHRPRRHHLIIAPLAIIAICYMAGPEIRAEFLSIGTFKEDTTAQMRLHSWNRGWQTAWDYPFTGAGVRNSNLMSEAYGAETNGRSVHNIYLQIAADSGIPAMMVHVGMLVTAVLLLWAFRNRLGRKARIANLHNQQGAADDDAEELRALALALEGSVIAFAAGGMFLSLEFFELPWVIVAMAGALPVVCRAEQSVELPAEHDDPVDAIPTPVGVRGASPA
jgi:probable O-glycosylation ligase (exosortase A-associated)